MAKKNGALQGQIEALDRAIKAAGGVTGLAGFISANYGQITTQAISQWQICPDKRVLQVERATAGSSKRPSVSRHELRPDLYPIENARAA